MSGIPSGRIMFTTRARRDVKGITTVLRLLMTYVIPLIVVGGVVFCGLWTVHDGWFGMYGSVDGKWMSWSHRSIMEWSSFLNFAPYSPFSGMGSLFVPNLPWLNPGALALAIPAPIEYKHLFSYLIYISELTLSLYFLFVELKIERAYAASAILLYFAFFSLPFNSISGVAWFYSLGPFLYHQTAAMNFATLALLRFGRSTLWGNFLWGSAFIVLLFSAFSAAPIFNLMSVPVYAVFWALLAFSSQADRRVLPLRTGLIVCTVAVFSIIGVPGYLSATAAMSARDNNMPAFLHPGWALLTFDYWRGLISRFLDLFRSSRVVSDLYFQTTSLGADRRSSERSCHDRLRQRPPSCARDDRCDDDRVPSLLLSFRIGPRPRTRAYRGISPTVLDALSVVVRGSGCRSCHDRSTWPAEPRICGAMDTRCRQHRRFDSSLNTVH